MLMYNRTDKQNDMDKNMILCKNINTLWVVPRLLPVTYIYLH